MTLINEFGHPMTAAALTKICDRPEHLHKLVFVNDFSEIQTLNLKKLKLEEYKRRHFKDLKYMSGSYKHFWVNPTNCKSPAAL